MLISFLVMMACSFGYEGVNFSDDPERKDPLQELIEKETFEAQMLENSSQPAESTPEPEDRPVIPQGSGNQNPETANAGSHNYSVEATNFNCICQVDGNITATFSFTEDQVDINGELYNKIGENTYKRSWMGYYILDSGSGDQVTSTVVDEEKHVVIIINSSGYRMEHYSGSSDSPCCSYSFTIIK